ncbi:hypothetical protein [Polaromonas sp. JS666]|uniref:hypothetical protein n=1 Tax=Polaromonas sp. (strain JS666 / ATCC BAA-500) TaxID=296591 RepID=UPI0000531C3B|nr:hypothetical protein [Polaromonas sp. JS666]
MRGLKTRVAYARAVVLAVIDDVKGPEAINDAYFDSQVDGVHDYRAGNFEVPAMIRDVPDLVLAWEYGQATAAMLTVANCESECNLTEGDEQ